MAKFSVCVVQRQYTACFDEFADSIEWGLLQLGHEVHRAPAAVPGTRGIYLGVYKEDVPEDAILVNCEQVANFGSWVESDRLQNLYRTHQVWDYSAANAARYKDWGIATPRVVRPGFAKCLEHRVPHGPKRYDVVFFGSMTDRRRDVLVEMTKLGLSVRIVPHAIYGDARDKIVGESELCVNIHYAPTESIFEAVRIQHLSHNDVPVLSESTPSGEEQIWGIHGVAYEQLAETAAQVISGRGSQEMARGARLALGRIPIGRELELALSGFN